jgi:hypothetical protein
MEAFYQDGWLPCELLARRRGTSSAVLVRVTAGADAQDIWVPSERLRAPGSASGKAG